MYKRQIPKGPPLWEVLFLSHFKIISCIDMLFWRCHKSIISIEGKHDTPFLMEMFPNGAILWAYVQARYVMYKEENQPQIFVARKNSVYTSLSSVDLELGDKNTPLMSSRFSCKMR